MLRRIKQALIGLAAAAALALIFVYGVSAARLSKSYDDVAGHPLVLPTDAEEIAEGGRLVRVFHCMDCHGEDLGGNTLVDDPMMATLAASNLTSGRGGVGGTYAPSDWERAIRHGVRPDGSGLVVMPSEDFAEMSNQDLGRIVAFLRSLPPVDRVPPRRRFGPVARGFLTSGTFRLAPEFEHHASDAVEGPAKEPTPEFGRYLVGVCMGCHGESLVGGNVIAPGTPPSANLTPHGTDGLGAWSYEDFERALRTGVRPDGRELAEMMPWRSFSYYEDVEVQALWAFLQTVPALASEATDG